MSHIKIRKGLNIPIEGKPRGEVQPLAANGRPVFPEQIALNLDPFDETRFRLLAKVGEVVKIGQPLAEDKATEGRMFVSPAGGVVREVRRGLKRRLVDIVIEVGEKEELHEHAPLDVETVLREALIDRLKIGGLFAHIRRRPFNLLAHPGQNPRDIFVKALESVPFAVPAELQVKGNEEDFQLGLTVLSKLTSGAVHLVYHKDSTCSAFTGAQNVKKHTAEGPHPIANLSVHIHHVSPIRHPEEVVWTLNAHDVVCIGYLMRTGRYFVDRIISIAGPAVLPERGGYFKARAGFPITTLIAGRVEKGLHRLISGDVLTGQKVEPEDFLGFYHYAFCVIREKVSREFLHFFRLGLDKFTASRAYLSGQLDNTKREYDFTTNQHGERRAFVISSPYDKVMPLRVPTMHLVKAVIAQDYDLAEELGLLEVDSEDFALPTFVCPSKIEMTEVIKNGLKEYAKEVLV